MLERVCVRVREGRYARIVEEGKGEERKGEERKGEGLLSDESIDKLYKYQILMNNMSFKF